MPGKAKTKTQLQQAKFRREYLKDGNGTRAAIAAGYSPRSAAQTASRLLKKANIGGAIQAAVDEFDFDAARIAREIAYLGLSNMKNYVGNLDLETMSRAHAAAIKKLTRETRYVGEGDDAEVIETVSLELYDKVRPLQMLGQHTGIFSEGASDPVTFQLIINIPAERPVINVSTPARPARSAA